MLSTTTELSVEPIQDFVQAGLIRQRGGNAHEVEKAAAFTAALTKLGRSELRRVRIALCNGTLRLMGEVTSYHAKQLAQEALRPLAFGLRIENQIRVVGRK